MWAETFNRRLHSAGEPFLQNFFLALESLFDKSLTLHWSTTSNPVSRKWLQFRLKLSAKKYCKEKKTVLSKYWAPQNQKKKPHVLVKSDKDNMDRRWLRKLKVVRKHKAKENRRRMKAKTDYLVTSGNAGSADCTNKEHHENQFKTQNYYANL